MNEILIEILALKLNQEMKNIIKKELTKENKSAIIDLSNEREVKSK